MPWGALLASLVSAYTAGRGRESDSSRLGPVGSSLVFAVGSPDLAWGGGGGYYRSYMMMYMYGSLDYAW